MRPQRARCLAFKCRASDAGGHAHVTIASIGGTAFRVSNSIQTAAILSQRSLSAKLRPLGLPAARVRILPVGVRSRKPRRPSR